MPYTHLLVAVAPTPESQVLIKKAVSIARPVNAKVSLITLATDPELYNQFAAPMMENLREVMQEETREFLNELARHADYPIERMTIACGELGHHIKDFCRSHRVDLVICGNHNHSLFSRATCSAKNIVGSCGVDVLLVSLKGLTPVSPFPELGQFREGGYLPPQTALPLRGEICCRSSTKRACQL